MENIIYLFVIMMLFLVFYVLIGHELTVATLLYLILLTLLGRANENK